MEIEASSSPSPQQVVARKLWNVVRIVFLMLRRGIAKSKVGVDLHVLLKRGKLAATKAIANTILQRSQNDDAVYPREYEFSCSNSPAFPFHVVKRSKRRRTRFPRYDDVSTVYKVEASPFPGFGKSPIGRKLRITDSPFPLKDEEPGDNQVDVAAEEFIKRFYKDLNLQHKMASIDSPFHYNLWDR